MERKLKICCNCEQPKVIWKAHEGCKYCQSCWQKQSPITKVIKPRQRIAPKSEKRMKEEKIYLGKRIIFLNKYPMCKAHLPGICTNQATDVHHKAGRAGDLYLDVTFWLPVCRTCHSWIETHPKEAREVGFSTSKINPQHEIN